ncbi:hypothetical protein PWT90_02394 [Aphanocladium album]|nr:hypothetical protein PWT90_02394 [Aphanocladium album]
MAEAGVDYQLADPVSVTTSYIVPNVTETFHPWEALGTPGTTKTWAVIATLDVELNLHAIRLYADSVVLPIELVRSWRSADGEFADAVSSPRAHLGPTSILVDLQDDTIGIIDWEIAGFLPIEWIRTKFRASSGMEEEGGGTFGRAELP